MCDCDLCKRTRLTNEKIAELPEDKREFFNNMFDYLLSVEFDKDYHDAIFSGGWPGGREVLERALEKYPK